MIIYNLNWFISKSWIDWIISSIYFLGQIPYWDYSDELLKIEEVLRTDPYIRNDSIAFWYTKFHEDCCVQEVQYCLDDMDIWGSMTCSDELGFKRRLFKFLEHNPIYVMDMRFNIDLKEISEEIAFDRYYDGNLVLDNGFFSVSIIKVEFRVLWFPLKSSKF